jgi:hypothetical protein
VDDEDRIAFESALVSSPTPPGQPVDDTRVMDTDTVARLAALAEGTPLATDATPLSHEGMPSTRSRPAC